MKGLYVFSIIGALFSVCILLTDIANHKQASGVLCFLVWAVVIIVWGIQYIQER